MQTKAKASRLKAIEDKLRPPKKPERVQFICKWGKRGEPRKPGVVYVDWNDKGGGHDD
jgi:hypothetical protein